MTYNLDFFNQFKKKGFYFEENNQQIYTFPNGYEVSVIQPFAQMELIGAFGHAEHEERELGVFFNGQLNSDAAKSIGLKRSVTKLQNDVQLIELLNKIYMLPEPGEDDFSGINQSDINAVVADYKKRNEA